MPRPTYKNGKNESAFRYNEILYQAPTKSTADTHKNPLKKIK